MRERLQILASASWLPYAVAIACLVIALIAASRHRETARRELQRLTARIPRKGAWRA
jgi:hypothetical protein